MLVKLFLKLVKIMEHVESCHGFENCWGLIASIVALFASVVQQTEDRFVNVLMVALRGKRRILSCFQLFDDHLRSQFGRKDKD
jgi:hypothetical protein